mgnify:CR=1 FL=1
MVAESIKYIPVSSPCNKCNKIFSRKSHLISHKERKTPCNTIVNNISKTLDFTISKCQKCDMIFTRYSSLQRHLKNTCKFADNSNKLEEKIDNLTNIVMKICEHKNSKQQSDTNKNNHVLHATSSSL